MAKTERVNLRLTPEMKEKLQKPQMRRTGR